MDFHSYLKGLEDAKRLYYADNSDKLLDAILEIYGAWLKDPKNWEEKAEKIIDIHVNRKR